MKKQQFVCEPDARPLAPVHYTPFSSVSVLWCEQVV
jgi:hypothetical protein